ncbi:MAG: hypothetical protein EU548_03265 [Promethearchaeota archaeon]|nr:MAG: hypothetical protein EU548_03265 [Candidatus Lokiarchaeota archaeon]
MDDPNISPSRGPPQKANPLIHKNIKYSAPWSKIGYIEARDVKTDKKLWELKVYEIEYNPNLERDAQEKYITSLTLNSGMLEVKTEFNEKYLINLKTKEIKKL